MGAVKSTRVKPAKLRILSREVAPVNRHADDSPSPADDQVSNCLACFSKVSASLTSNLPGASMLRLLTTPLSTSME
jgi:hypothetical protein